MWVVGFALEADADLQKSRFRADPANKGSVHHAPACGRGRATPTTSARSPCGWASRSSPLPVLQGWQFVTLISPVFVYLLITRVSGVPLLEKKADETWGGQEAYEAYKRRTPVLVPFLGRKKR